MAAAPISPTASQGQGERFDVAGVPSSRSSGDRDPAVRDRRRRARLPRRRIRSHDGRVAPGFFALGQRGEADHVGDARVLEVALHRLEQARLHLLFGAGAHLAKRGGQLGGVSEARIRGLPEGPFQDRLELGGDVGARVEDRGGGVLEDARDGGGDVLRAELVSTHQQLVEHHRAGVGIRARARILEAEELRGEVGHLALDGALLGLFGLIGAARHAEVGELHQPLHVDEDVRWRHVAMHDVEQLAVVALEVVRVVKRIEHLDDDVNDEVWRERTMHLLVEAIPLSEVVAVDVLDDHQVVALLLTEVDHPHQSGMPQARHQSCLAHEHARHALVDHQVGGHALDDHRLGEA